GLSGLTTWRSSATSVAGTWCLALSRRCTWGTSFATRSPVPGKPSKTSSKHSRGADHERRCNRRRPPGRSPGEGSPYRLAPGGGVREHLLQDVGVHHWKP